MSRVNSPGVACRRHRSSICGDRTFSNEYKTYPHPPAPSPEIGRRGADIKVPLPLGEG
ncbi:hypothetical protein FDUTEX481_06849, partial [Tolypothrix sp. PCC 7601]